MIFSLDLIGFMLLLLLLFLTLDVDCICFTFTDEECLTFEVEPILAFFIGETLRYVFDLLYKF